MKDIPNVKVYVDLRDSKGLTDYRVSKLTGVAQQTLSSWQKQDYFPKRDKIGKIANFFEVPIEVFYRPDDVEEITQQVMNEVETQMFEVSAGQGRINDGYGEPMKACDGQTAKVVGDSMYPVLLDGDIVRFIESTDVTPSDLALVRIDGEAVTVKYVEWTDDGMWVRAENKDVFEDKFFTVKEIATIPVQIVGKAVEIVSRKL